jgi:K+-sensing histidine kinase KdpD
LRKNQRRGPLFRIDTDLEPIAVHEPSAQSDEKYPRCIPMIPRREESERTLSERRCQHGLRAGAPKLEVCVARRWSKNGGLGYAATREICGLPCVSGRVCYQLHVLWSSVTSTSRALVLGFRGQQATKRVGVLRHYLAGVLVVAVFSVLSMAFSGFVSGLSTLGTRIFAVTFPLGMLFMTIRFGVGPAIFTAVTGVLVFDYVFLPPALEFTMPNLKDGVTVGAMFATAATATVYAERLRRQIQWTRRQAEVEGLRNALLSGLSHDLRTPLGALVAAGRALHEDQLDPEERRDFSRMVFEESARLNRLVGRLLELTRLESGRLTSRPGLQAIDEVIGSALYRLEKELGSRSVRTHVPEEVPLTTFDPILIEQVMINLVENAIRHTPANSPIYISAWVHEDDILVEVADRGPGVPSGDEERVFEKFYRVGGHRQGDGGMGLGLTLCRAIVAAHDGRIWLDNRPGGAVVRFTLPIHDDATSEQRSPQGLASRKRA